MGNIGRLLIDYCEGKLDQCNIISGTNNLSDLTGEFKIFPNPCVDKITIMTDATIKKVVIFDHYGSYVLESLVTEINVSHLSAGIYYVKCQLDHNVPRYFKMMKSN